MTLMLLCAGEGTRLRPHTHVLPKPAIPFLTVPMAAYGLEWAREISPERFVVNTYHLPEKIHRLFNGLQGVHGVAFSDEQPLLMGSGGGVMKAKPLIKDDDFLVMNGDEIFLPSRDGQLREAWAKHKASKAIATMVVMKYPGVGTVFGGVWTKDDEVLGFGKTALAGSTEAWHYIGAIFLSKRIFNFLPQGKESNLLYDGLASALAAGEKVRIAPVAGWWHETGNEKDYLKASGEAMNMLAAGAGYEPRFLKSVLKAHSPDAIFDAAAMTLSFSPNKSATKGFAVIGRKAALHDGENENAVLGDGVHATSILKNQLLLA